MSLESLRKKRLKWVEANKENEFEEGIKGLLTDLYPDNAHFIYELLQNAEDARASNVRFTLTCDAVEFEHDGKRLFDIKDVESITSIALSTKRDDPTSIGQFGVGFKAVFAYTKTPEIYSGDFHFRIHDLVVPDTDAVSKSALGGNETRFVLPFDHLIKLPAKAAEEVEIALRALGDSTLLFLKNIHTIEYLLPNDTLGSIERIEHENGRIEIRSRHPGGEESVSHWLRFKKDAQVADKKGKSQNHMVAVAYALQKIEDEKNKKRQSVDWEIVPLDHGQVSIYFPALKEASNLRFHIHAPFASTVARDSVRDCEANNQLRNHIAELVVESLTSIRDEGMLTVGFLSVLPNSMDNLSEFYKPILEAVVEEFKNNALTPTRSGIHAPATKLYRGLSRIAEVFGDNDLSLLKNSETVLWAANPPPQKQRADRFLESLVIKEFGWWDLINILSLSGFQWDVRKNYRQRIEDWIAGKDDSWLMRFYALLGEACENYSIPYDAKILRIVRVETDQGHQHVLPFEAFFPPDLETRPTQGIHFVKKTVFSKGRSEAQKRFATSFLEHIGVRPFDERAIIELILESYPKSDEINENHYKDIKQFVAYWKKHPENIEIFQGRHFLLGFNENDELDWYKGDDLCLDEPYEKTGLSELSEIHEKYSIWPDYNEILPKTTRKWFIDFLKEIGVMHELEITETNINKNVSKALRRYYWQRWTKTIINIDYTIPELDLYLAEPSIQASRLIWNTVISADSEVATARFRPNKQYQILEAESQLVNSLKSHAWIPDKDGSFHKPEDIAQDELHNGFSYDDHNGLLKAIGFGEQAKKRSEDYQVKNEAAKEMGFGSADEAEEYAQIARESGMTPSKLRSLVCGRPNVTQPEESVPNPERRRKGVSERRDNAPTRESVTRERRIQPGEGTEIHEAKAYLRAKYRNSEGQLICQCCHEEMPFKIKEEHYFEAVQCVRGLDQHHFENRLALCPTCAAMYQHARETKDAEIRQAIIELNSPDTAPSAEITIRLAGRQFLLRFVGTHWFDLKTILKG